MTYPLVRIHPLQMNRQQPCQWLDHYLIMVS